MVSKPTLPATRQTKTVARSRSPSGATLTYFLDPLHADLREKKVGRFVGRPKQVSCELSAHVGDALLGIRLGRGHWLRRQLKHCCRLTLAQ